MKTKTIPLVILNMFLGIGGFLFLLSTGFMITPVWFHIGMLLGAWGFLMMALYIIWILSKKESNGNSY